MFHVTVLPKKKQQKTPFNVSRPSLSLSWGKRQTKINWKFIWVQACGILSLFVPIVTSRGVSELSIPCHGDFQSHSSEGKAEQLSSTSKYVVIRHRKLNAVKILVWRTGYSPNSCSQVTNNSNRDPTCDKRKMTRLTSGHKIVLQLLEDLNHGLSILVYCRRAFFIHMPWR